MDIYKKALSDCREQIIELNNKINTALFNSQELYQDVKKRLENRDLSDEQAKEILNALWWHVCNFEVLYKISQGYALNAALKSFSGK